MRRILLSLALVAVLVCLCSCELSVEAPKVGKVHILAYGNDFNYGTKTAGGWTSNVYMEGEVTRYGVLSGLEFPPDDAIQVSNALAAIAERCGLEHDEVCIAGVGTPSKFEDMTKARLFNEIEDLKDRAQSNDITFLFFSCHGEGFKKEAQDYGTDVSEETFIVLAHDTIPKANILVPIS